MSFLHMKGVAVPHHKNTAGAEPVRMPPPAMVVLPMVMHIGAPRRARPSKWATR